MTLKKIFFSFVLISTFLTLKAQSNQNEIVKTLQESSALQRNLNFISKYGQINFDEAAVRELNIKASNISYLIVLPIYNNGKITARLEAVNMIVGKLPNKDEFALNLLDLGKIDLSNKSGEILMYDLNYEAYMHTTVSIESNKIKSWDAKGLSEELTLKYYQPELKQKATNNKADTQSREDIYTLCDTNGNHNISFGECYKCAKDAISANGFSDWVCDIPVLGWLECWGTTTATCVVVSGMY